MQNLALRRDGTVLAWGNESEAGKLPPGLTNIVAIAAGYNHFLALKADGTVLGWGYNRSGEATGVPTLKEPHISTSLVAVNGHTLSNVVAIAAGQNYSLAVKSDGSIGAWGEPRAYSPVPFGLSGVTRVAAGRGFCLAITTNTIAFSGKN